MAVLHVGPEVLKRVNDFCRKHDIVRKGWVSTIMLSAVNAGVVDPTEYQPRQSTAPAPTSKELEKARKKIRELAARLEEEKRKKQPILAPVARQRVHELPTGDKLAAHKSDPFWKKKGNNNGEEDEAEAGPEAGPEDR
jgi:hypothetical protein